MTPEEQYRQAEDDFQRATAAMDEARNSLETARRIRNEARSRMHELRPALRAQGKSIGGQVFGSGGFVADVVTGGMNVTFDSVGPNVTVVGRIINGGVPKRCTSCGGTDGWRTAGGITTHMGCGAVQ